MDYSILFHNDIIICIIFGEIIVILTLLMIIGYIVFMTKEYKENKSYFKRKTYSPKL